MDLERFPLPGTPQLMPRHQIFVIMIGKSAAMKDQSQRGTRQFLYWFWPSSNSATASLAVLCYEIRYPIDCELLLL
jgi:hypothetical protein